MAHNLSATFWNGIFQKKCLPCLSALVRKLGVSRSSLKRTMKRLRDNGAFELVHVKSKPEAKVYTIYYKIN